LLAVGKWFHTVYIVTAFMSSIVLLVGLTQAVRTERDSRLLGSGGRDMLDYEGMLIS